MIVTKTVCQHSEKLPEETMKFLRGIAEDYAKVKNAVYERYSGIRSVERINFSFNVQKEMRLCGLRQQLNLPSAYYEVAVVEALTNIKAMWSLLKNKIRDAIRYKENLTDDDRMYIRTILKVDRFFAAVLSHRVFDLPKNAEGLSIDTKRLNNLICRLVRRNRTVSKVTNVTQFQVIGCGYRYKDKGIYLVSRVSRKRVYIPLKDVQTSSRQIRVKICENSVEIRFPIDVEVKEPNASADVVYAYIGHNDALTLSNGNIYGKDLAELVDPETERLNVKNIERGKMLSVYANSTENGNLRKAKRIEIHNLGRKKYDEQKRRIREKTQNYINSEINRMLSEEKPRCIVITKPVMKNRTKHYVKETNRRLTRRFSGYIRRRLEEKCRFHGIKLISISSKDTGSVCSSCGAIGIRENNCFRCDGCGYSSTIAQNSALNIEKKAISEGIC